jgi:hypothetical protein
MLKGRARLLAMFAGRNPMARFDAKRRRIHLVTWRWPGEGSDTARQSDAALRITERRDVLSGGRPMPGRRP